jgi:hypothetical protein
LDKEMVKDLLDRVKLFLSYYGEGNLPLIFQCQFNGSQSCSGLFMSINFYNQTWRLKMKNKLFIIVLMTTILLLVAGCVPDTISKNNTPVPNTQASTPTANGEINVPGFNIQINAPGSNPLVNKADGANPTASTLLGIWHGIISPVTLVISFINPSAQIYEVYNDGSKYNLGFLVGVAIVFLILGALIGSRRR